MNRMCLKIKSKLTRDEKDVPRGEEQVVQVELEVPWDLERTLVVGYGWICSKGDLKVVLCLRGGLFGG